GDVLRAGRIDLDGDDDELFWSMRLSLHPSAAKSVAITEGAAWLAVMDHAEGRAELLSVTREGVAQALHLEALGLPAIGERHVVFQPASDRVVRRAFADGSEESFDVSAHNAHPCEAPEPLFYDGAAPPPPSRLLAGEVHLAADRALF